MTTSESFVGRVALPSGQALAGFVVELVVGGQTHTAVTDGIGEFRLEATVPPHPAEYPTGELAVRLPDSQVVLRELYPLDGRYLGLTVSRDALPRGGPRRGMQLPPLLPDDAPVDAVDVGDQGELQLPRLDRVEMAGNRRVAAVGDRIAVASGPVLSIWTVDGTDARGPVRLEVGADVFDLAADPLRAEIVLLVTRSGKRAGRALLAVGDDGQLEQRWSGDGDWDRLAVSPDIAAVAMAAAGSTTWAGLVGGDLQIHDLESTVSDIAFAGAAVVLATGQELLVLELTGDLLGRTEWPGQEPVLVEADAAAVLAYDPASGRATRLLAGAGGQPTADATISVGTGAAFGWWWDRSLLVTLFRDQIAWWRPPPVVLLQPRAEQSDIVFVGPI